MHTILWIMAWFLGFGLLAYHRVSRTIATLAIGGGLLITTFVSTLSVGWLILSWALFMSIATVINHTAYRRTCLMVPLLHRTQGKIPTLSRTEQTALESGDLWWEADLFRGRPDWEKFGTIHTQQLTNEERDFLAGPVEQACQMTNDWEITQCLQDIPPQLLAFVKKAGFFGMIIPKEYGGKGFSAAAHSAIVMKLASKSVTLSTTIAVPNTLGPAELLLHYGTPAQKNYYLPRLATGEEIPCFALTGPEAGSDASAIPDTGIICEGVFEGREILGVRLNWNKRYITLAPIATTLGLAFHLYDPDHRLGQITDIGITCALIPVTTVGVIIGRRHAPSGAPFQNGPTQGKDVFIPLDWIIGGTEMAGQGWRMLMECLSIGRAITLPSSTTGGAKFGLQATGAYTQIRRQFNNSLCHFEGVQEALARIAGYTYLCDATRAITVAGVDAQKKPAIASAISKYHVTEMSRQIAIDAIDLHGGKAIMAGPKNYLLSGYHSAPISITVEGANILTRNLIIFGQGAIRCHPYLLDEMDAMRRQDIDLFDTTISAHAGYLLSNMASAIFHGLTNARFASAPAHTTVARLYQHCVRASSALAWVSDTALLLLGGSLKSRENLSARLGDLLSYTYLATAALKRYAEDKEPPEDLPLITWAVQDSLAHFWTQMDGLVRNFPIKPIAWMLRWAICPWGCGMAAPSDHLSRTVANLFSQKTATRTRLLQGMYDFTVPGSPAFALEQALEATLAAAPIEKKIKHAIKAGFLAIAPLDDPWEAAYAGEHITEAELQVLRHAHHTMQLIIAVDDFAPETLHRSAAF